VLAPPWHGKQLIYGLLNKVYKRCWQSD